MITLAPCSKLCPHLVLLAVRGHHFSGGLFLDQSSVCLGLLLGEVQPALQLKELPLKL